MALPLVLCVLSFTSILHSNMMLVTGYLAPDGTVAFISCPGPFLIWWSASIYLETMRLPCLFLSTPPYL